MTETVRYEHVINENAGFEVDYEYESLERYSGSDTERFVSCYDDKNDPMNYLEIRYLSEDPENVTAKMKEDLSGDFDTVNTDKKDLINAGQCTCLSAYGVKSGRLFSGAMQSIYIIPAGSGSIVAEAHYTIESAEGFGSRFFEIINTLTILK